MDFLDFDYEERARHTASPAETLVADRYGACMSVSDLLLVDDLGEGGGGRVSRARHRETAQLFAVKAAHRDFKTKRGAERVINEVMCMRLAQDYDVPCVAQLVAAFKDGDKDDVERSYIVMELYAGDLAAVILSNDALTFPPSTLRIWTAQLVAAICGLHAIGILHRDVKPENVFLTSRGQVRLGDFGLACIRRVPTLALRSRAGLRLDAWKIREPAGTPDYVAPEIIREKAYGTPVDFWGLGIVVFFMHFRHNPFADVHGDVHLIKILKHTVTFPHYRKRSDALLENLILALLCKDPRHRLGRRVKEHPYFVCHANLPEIDWRSIHLEDSPLPDSVLHRRSVAILDSWDSLAAASPTPKKVTSFDNFLDLKLGLTERTLDLKRFSIDSIPSQSVAPTMWWNGDQLEDYVVVKVPAFEDLEGGVQRRRRSSWGTLCRLFANVARLRWLQERLRLILKT